jgi:hypothetical protein
MTVGLKEVVERLTRKKPTTGHRGARGPRERKRDRDEATVQVPTGLAGGPAPQPPPPAYPPPPQQAPGAAPRPPVAQPPPAYTPPPAPPPAAQPAYQEPVPPAPAVPATQRPAAPAKPSSAEATQYVTVPGFSHGELIGVLVGIDGQLKGDVFKVMDGDNRIGRSQECDIHLLDPKVSREHAMIAYDDGVLLILPLNEKNPVYLNDDVIEEGDQLSDGDKLRFGNPGSSVFRFRTIEGQ